MSAEFAPVRAVFRGWRELSGKRITTVDGAFPSVNDIGISGRAGGKKNWPYINAKAIYSIALSALLREPSGTEYEFIKPGTVGVRCLITVERDGELPDAAAFMLIEGRCIWPDLNIRDQTNYTAIIGKFVPDVLEADGYLAAHDDWFGLQVGNFDRGLNRKSEPYTELMFFPSPDRIAPVDEGANSDPQERLTL